MQAIALASGTNGKTDAKNPWPKFGTKLLSGY